MDKFLETLQSRLTEAHKRFVEAQQAFTKSQAEMNQFQQTFAKAQVEFQAASQEFNSWQVAVRVESRKQQIAIPEQAQVPVQPQPPRPPFAQRIVPRINQPAPPLAIPAPPAEVIAVPQQVPMPAPEINKTAVIRQVLTQHPAGITPKELWKEAGNQITQRPYMYSILKRLKDNDEVSVRRGKYIIKSFPVAQEAGNRTTVVQ